MNAVVSKPSANGGGVLDPSGWLVAAAESGTSVVVILLAICIQLVAGVVWIPIARRVLGSRQTAARRPG